MKHPMFLLVCSSLILLAACGPGTPAPNLPTVLPTTQATSNFRATESSIISHVFATMTASAPTPTKPPIVAPTAEPKPTATTKPRATAAVKAATPTRVPPPAGGNLPPPTPSGDPYLAQIPKGRGGFLVVNYVGDHSAIVTFSPNKYTVAPNGTQLIILDPGTYSYSVQIDGVPGGGSTGTVDIKADKYTKYSVTLPQ